MQSEEKKPDFDMTKKIFKQIKSRYRDQLKVEETAIATAQDTTAIKRNIHMFDQSEIN
jgi:hypothetical protein